MAWISYEADLLKMKELFVKQLFFYSPLVFPHCVPHRVKIVEILCHTVFQKNFVKSMVLLKKLLNSWFDEFFFHTVLCAVRVVDRTWAIIDMIFRVPNSISRKMFFTSFHYNLPAGNERLFFAKIVYGLKHRGIV